MRKEQKDFMEIHASNLSEMKAYLGRKCLAIRQRNNLSREYVADMCGVSDRSIAKIEHQYTVSIDLVNILFNFYSREGYATRQEQEECSFKELFLLADSQ